MPRDVHLRVLLTRNRNHPGWLCLEVDGVPEAEFRVLGRGSRTVKGKRKNNHPSLSPFADGGNTPTGDYVSPGIVDTSGWNRDSYGPWGAIRLTAVAGDALLAKDVFGRKGLLIHGGAPGRFDGYRSTLGCLRMSDNDMKTLVALISDAGDNASAMRCEGVQIRVTVRG
jgi:hypothetical protein